MAVIYEERRTVLKRHALEPYRRLMLEQVWPALIEAGTRPLCLLSGLVGMPPEETYTIVGYRDPAEWERLQFPASADRADGPRGRLRDILGQRAELVADESVRLMRPSSTRPKSPTPNEELRPIYGLRRFLLRPGDWERFDHDSNVIWGGWEDQLASPILGMFRGAATTDPLPVTLLTGYRSVSHWEQTRGLFQGGTAERPAHVSPEAWAELLRAYRSRNLELPLTAYVCLMQAHWPET